MPEDLTIDELREITRLYVFATQECGCDDDAHWELLGKLEAHIERRINGQSTRTEK